MAIVFVVYISNSVHSTIMQSSIILLGFGFVTLFCVVVGIQLPQQPYYKDLGIEFTETMTGYFDKGNFLVSLSIMVYFFEN